MCDYTLGFNDLVANYRNMTSDYIPEWVIQTLKGDLEYNPLIFSAIGSVLVGLSGVMPLLIIPIDETANLKHGAGANTLKVLLSFAVGGLLGDVFLHLLPEAWANDVRHGSNGHPSLYSGMLVLLGIVVFVAAEKLFSGLAEVPDEEEEQEDLVQNVNNNTKDHHLSKTNGFVKPVNGIKPVKQAKQKQVSGYLNLLANSIDNFTHGLAVGGSFLISLRLGALTTGAILVHEVPHEVGDFAILLRSGFSRIDAACGQILTASAGLVGAMVAVGCSGSMDESRTSWILPFTAGGFLHIALVSVLPDLLKEDDPKESLKQLAALLLGIIVMAGLTSLE